MKNTGPGSRYGYVCAILFAVLLSGTAGADIIEIRPQALSAGVGETITVDVFASNLQGEIVSAYDLDVVYDSLILTATDVVFGIGLGNSLLLEVFEDFDLSAPGLVDLAQLSLLPDDMLFGMQGGDEILLATLFFETLRPGETTLDFVFDAFNDVKTFDAAILPVSGVAGQVTVEGPVAVPEPPSWALLLPGLCLLLARRRRSAADSWPIGNYLVARSNGME